MGIGQNAVGPPDVVIDHLGLLLQQRRPRVFLVLDDLGEDLFQPLHDGRSRIRPRVIWLDTWKTLPSASVPSP